MRGLEFLGFYVLSAVVAADWTMFYSTGSAAMLGLAIFGSMLWALTFVMYVVLAVQR